MNKNIKLLIKEFGKEYHYKNIKVKLTNKEFENLYWKALKNRWKGDDD